MHDYDRLDTRSQCLFQRSQLCVIIPANQVISDWLLFDHTAEILSEEIIVHFYRSKQKILRTKQTFCFAQIRLSFA